jgi:hypothetical protein
MSIIQGTAKGGSTGFYDFPIGDSLRFDGSSYLSRDMTGTAKVKWSFSFWFKRSVISKTGYEPVVGDGYADHDGLIAFEATDKLIFLDKQLVGGVGKTNYSRTNSVYRDTSAFYHIVTVFDSTQSSVSDGLKIYINGELAPRTSGADNWPRQSLGWFLGNMYIGRVTSYYLNGYLANIQFIDGQALDQYFFGEFKDNIWVPYNAFSTAGSGTATASDNDTATDSYGTNGFHLDFADSSNIGNDVSGNNNDWTVN